MALARVLVPRPLLFAPPWSLLGLLPMALGAWLALATKRTLERRATPVDPTRPPTSLVTEGVFARSRNPMYLGMVVFAFGVAIVMGSVSAMLVSLAYGFFVRLVFVMPEERRLAERFGDEYRAYEGRVRRWI